MVHRNLIPYAQKLATQYPVITILGPRQAGKTTLAKSAFPKKEYVNLEHPMTRDFAHTDPVGFLEQYPNGAILDEIQRVPMLLSYIQTIVDQRDEEGLFILTGSHQFDLRQGINQSLAGRTAMLKLLPFTMSELSAYGNFSVDERLYSGFYPRIHEKKIEPTQAYSDYLETYIERDLRQIIMIKDLLKFRTFLRLLAGRVGQLLNITNLANDTGVSQATIKEWISVLEASFICFRLEPWQPTIRKRVTKTPKLYFYDVGLASMLIGIEKSSQIATHPLRGGLYENMVIVDVLKHRYNCGATNNLLFFRDSNGNEIDLLYLMADKMIPIEIKSGKTISQDYFKGINHFTKTFDTATYGSFVVYSGATEQKRSNCKVVNDSNIVSEIQIIEAEI